MLHRSDLVLDFLIILTILLTLLSLTSYRKSNYIIDNTTHFKLQYLLISFCLFFFFLATNKFLWCLVNLLIICINLSYILPWYFHPPQVLVESSNKIRFFQANLEHNNKQYSWVIERVREEAPDIVVFLEVTKIWAKKLEILEQNYSYSFIHLEPYHIRPPLWYLQDQIIDLGIGIYSKLPLENTLVEDLGGGRKTIVTTVKNKKNSFFLVTTHPSFPVRKSGFELRNKQLFEIGNYVKKLNQPVVIVGDFNISMWSPYYQEFIGQAQLYNTRKGFGILPSLSIVKSFGTSLAFFRNPRKFFRICPSFPIDIPVDHCLVSPEISVINTRLGKKIGSDHLPLITDLFFSDLETLSINN